MTAKQTCEIVRWHQDFILCSLLDWASSLVLDLTAHAHFDVCKYLLLYIASPCTNEGDIFYDQEIPLSNMISATDTIGKRKGCDCNRYLLGTFTLPTGKDKQSKPSSWRQGTGRTVSPHLQLWFSLASKTVEFFIKVSMAISLKPSVLVWLDGLLIIDALDNAQLPQSGHQSWCS